MYCWILNCGNSEGNTEKLFVSKSKPLLLALRIYFWGELMLSDSGAGSQLLYLAPAQRKKNI